MIIRVVGFMGQQKASRRIEASRRPRDMVFTQSQRVVCYQFLSLVLYSTESGNAVVLWRRMASASSIRTLTSQLRNAPSYSNLGGFRDAVILQLCTASLTFSGLLRMRHARRWRSGRHRENRSSNTMKCSFRLFRPEMFSSTRNSKVKFIDTERSSLPRFTSVRSGDV
jgi:hypothetical protein